MEINTDKVISSESKNKIRVYKKKFPGSPLTGIVFKFQIINPIKNGVAHLFEHLLCNQILKTKGLIISGSTNRSCISIKILGNKSKVKLNLLNILESIARPQFTYSQLLKERPIIIEEIKNYRINKIQNFANKARNQMFYKNMQEYDIVLGSISDVESIDLRDLFDFALHNLVSENIRCLIAGDDLNFFETQIRNYNFEQGSVCKSNVPKKTNSNSLCFDKIVRIRNNGRQIWNCIILCVRMNSSLN